MRIYVRHTRSMRRPARRPLATLSVAIMATACGMVLAVGAYARNHRTRHAHVHRLSVFAHPLKRRARAAYTDAGSIPAGAVLAEMFGSAEVYVSEEAGMLCLTVIEAPSGGSSCGRSNELQNEALLDVNVSSGHVRVGVLMPNGVNSMALFDHDGTSHVVKITNNVAEAYDSNVASVQYKLPDGSTRTENIPPHVLNPYLDS